MADGEILVFDRRAVRRHRERAARLRSAEFLFDEAADRLAGRPRAVAAQAPAR